FFFFQAEDGIRDFHVTGVQTCALPISIRPVGQGCRHGRRSGPLHRPHRPHLRRRHRPRRHLRHVCHRLHHPQTHRRRLPHLPRLGRLPCLSYRHTRRQHQDPPPFIRRPVPPRHHHEPDQSQGLALLPGLPAPVHLSRTWFSSPADLQLGRPLHAGRLPGLHHHRHLLGNIWRTPAKISPRPTLAEPYCRHRLRRSGITPGLHGAIESHPE